MVGHHLHGDIDHTFNLRFAPDWAQLGVPGHEVIADQISAGCAGESASSGPTEVTAAVSFQVSGVAFRSQVLDFGSQASSFSSQTGE